MGPWLDPFKCVCNRYPSYFHFVKKTCDLKGELTWKIHLYILLPKYVYLFIQCTKTCFNNLIIVY